MLCWRVALTHKLRWPMAKLIGNGVPCLASSRLREGANPKTMGMFYKAVGTISAFVWIGDVDSFRQDGESSLL